MAACTETNYWTKSQEVNRVFSIIGHQHTLSHMCRYSSTDDILYVCVCVCVYWPESSVDLRLLHHYRNGQSVYFTTSHSSTL